MHDGILGLKSMVVAVLTHVIKTFKPGCILLNLY